MMEEFNPKSLADKRPLGLIAILTPNDYMARRINRDVKDMGLEREIKAFFPGQATLGYRFRKLYVGYMHEDGGLNMPYERYIEWFDERVRCRLTRGGEIVDSSCLRSQHSTLLQHIIETDSELPL